MTGLVVNKGTNTPRAEYDRLKAVLTNCARGSADVENRDAHPDFRAHLLGKLNWVAQANPVRGAKLMSLFESIDWNGK